MGLQITFCMNSGCKFYWEDSCTRFFEGKYARIDSDGKCMDFAAGESDYYEEAREEGNK